MQADASTMSPGARCLKCDYDLRGLGVPCICPECGTEFDPLAFFVTIKPASRYVRNIIGSVLLLAFLIWAFRSAPSPSNMPNGALIVLGVNVVYCVIQVVRLRQSSAKWYVNHSGIHLLDGAYQPKSIDWSHYGLTRCSWIWQRLRIDDPSGHRVISFPYRRLGTHRFACEIARRLNSAAALYEVKRRDGELTNVAASTASHTNPRNPAPSS